MFISLDDTVCFKKDDVVNFENKIVEQDKVIKCLKHLLEEKNKKINFSDRCLSQCWRNIDCLKEENSLLYKKLAKINVESSFEE